MISAPPRELVERLPEFYFWLVPRLRFLNSQFPQATPTSWYRSESRNIAVGGALRSQHLLGWAADFGSLNRNDRAAFVSTARRIGLVPVDEGDHVHVQMFPAGVVPAHFFPKRFSV